MKVTYLDLPASNYSFSPGDLIPILDVPEGVEFYFRGWVFSDNGYNIDGPDTTHKYFIQDDMLMCNLDNTGLVDPYEIDNLDDYEDAEVFIA